MASFGGFCLTPCGPRSKLSFLSGGSDSVVNFWDEVFDPFPNDWNEEEIG